MSTAAYCLAAFCTTLAVFVRGAVSVVFVVLTCVFVVAGNQLHKESR